MSGSLRLSGQAGQILIKSKVQAELATWSKGGARKLESGQKACTVTFTVKRVDQYWAGYGPPTTVALSLLGRRLTYEVISGDIHAGALVVKLPPRVEKT